MPLKLNFGAVLLLPNSALEHPGAPRCTCSHPGFGGQERRTRGASVLFLCFKIRGAQTLSCRFNVRTATCSSQWAVPGLRPARGWALSPPAALTHGRALRGGERAGTGEQSSVGLGLQPAALGGQPGPFHLLSDTDGLSPQDRGSVLPEGARRVLDWGVAPCPGLGGAVI